MQSIKQTIIIYSKKMNVYLVLCTMVQILDSHWVCSKLTTMIKVVHEEMDFCSPIHKVVKCPRYCLNCWTYEMLCGGDAVDKLKTNSHKYKSIETNYPNWVQDSLCQQWNDMRLKVAAVIYDILRVLVKDGINWN